MISSPRALVARVLRPLLRAAERANRPGPWHLPISGGWLPADVGNRLNWWQHGHDLVSYSPSAIVERCIGLYAETIASLPGTHWRLSARGGRSRVTESALSRVLRRPNSYETWSSFMLNAVHSLYSHGNLYALVLRNNRFEAAELHLMNARVSAPVVVRDDDDSAVFYRLGGNAVIEHKLGEGQIVVPDRDVLHVALRASNRSPWPLVGESPLAAAMPDVATSAAFTQQQLRFLANEARPSAVLSTDLVLDRDQVQALRDRWNEQSRGLAQGGVPILTGGLKVMPWSTPARDAQLAELTQASAERIAIAFGIPLPLIGLGSAPLGSTEALLRFWASNSLGFVLAHIEAAFDRLFDLKGPPDEYCEFDVEALLRSDPKDRIEMLARGVQGGIYAPNEARAAEGLDAVPYGDEVRTQAQNVPLSAAGAIPTAPTAPVPEVAPSAAAEMRALDLDALRSRAQRPKSFVASDGAASPDGRIVRKVTERPVRFFR